MVVDKPNFFTQGELQKYRLEEETTLKNKPGINAKLCLFGVEKSVICICSRRQA